MKKIVFFLMMFFTVAIANAGNDKKSVETEESEPAVAVYNLKGSVYDATDNEGLAGAAITIDGKKYYSDFAGNFQISELKQGKYTVSVNFISYQTKTVEIDLNDNREVRIDIKQQ